LISDLEALAMFSIDRLMGASKLLPRKALARLTSMLSHLFAAGYLTHSRIFVRLNVS